MLILICILQNKDNPAPVTVMDFCGESGLLAVGDQQGKVPPKIDSSQEDISVTVMWIVFNNFQ
jgi:hypothetical protein